MTQVLGPRTMDNAEALTAVPLIEQGPSEAFDIEKVGKHTGGRALLGYMTEDDFTAFEAEFPAGPDVYDEDGIGPDGYPLLPTNKNPLNAKRWNQTWLQIEKDAWVGVDKEGGLVQSKLDPRTLDYLNRLSSWGDLLEEAKEAAAAAKRAEAARARKAAFQSGKLVISKGNYDKLSQRDAQALEWDDDDFTIGVPSDSL